MEPELNRNLYAGLLVRDAGVLDPYEMIVAVTNTCQANRVDIKYN